MSSWGTCFQEIPSTCVLAWKSGAGGLLGSPAVLSRVQLLRGAICPVGCFVLKHEPGISLVLSAGHGKEPGSQRGVSGPQGKPGLTLCIGSSLSDRFCPTNTSSLILLSVLMEWIAQPDYTRGTLCALLLLSCS